MADPSKRKPCTTLFRKGASTGVRQMDIANKQGVADLMGHSLATAEKHYHIRDKRISAVSAGNSVRSIFTQATKKEGKRIWSCQEDDILRREFSRNIKEECIIMPEVSSKVPIIGIQASPKKIYDKVRSIIRSPKKTMMKTVERRKMFDEMELAELRRACADMINGGKINRGKIETALCGTICLEKYSWSQIRTRIMYERSLLK